MTTTNDMLNQLQADATVFYQKARAFHWTVAGQQFFLLHEQFEEIYTRWAEHIDAIAERVVINGGTPLTTLSAVLSRAGIRDNGAAIDARAMIETLVADLQRLLAVIAQALSAAETDGSRGTIGLLEGIRDQEEKALWMLSALLR